MFLLQGSLLSWFRELLTEDILNSSGIVDHLRHHFMSPAFLGYGAPRDDRLV